MKKTIHITCEDWQKQAIVALAKADNRNVSNYILNELCIIKPKGKK